MAARLTPLREEHAHLRPHIDGLRAAADAVGDAEPAALAAAVDEAIAFLVHHLSPHAGAEDAALYPVVQRVLGAPQATATMTRDHVEVHRLAEQLAATRAAWDATSAPDATTQRELRRLLYGLHAVVGLHFAKEEEVYVPLLEAALTPAEADAMFADLHRAAESLRGTGHHGEA